MEIEDRRGTLPPEQVADLASRCGIKGSVAASAEPVAHVADSDYIERDTCISPLATRRVLYTDTINGGNQSMRDDLWAVSTRELNDMHNALQNAATVTGILQAKIKRLEEQQNQHRPDYLLNGTRFKLNFSTRGNVDVFHNYATELQGRWVALVPADDDMHLTTKEPA